MPVAGPHSATLRLRDRQNMCRAPSRALAFCLRCYRLALHGNRMEIWQSRVVRGFVPSSVAGRILCLRTHGKSAGTEQGIGVQRGHCRCFRAAGAGYPECRARGGAYALSGFPCYAYTCRGIGRGRCAYGTGPALGWDFPALACDGLVFSCAACTACRLNVANAVHHHARLVLFQRDRTMPDTIPLPDGQTFGSAIPYACAAHTIHAAHPAIINAGGG